MCTIHAKRLTLRDTDIRLAGHIANDWSTADYAHGARVGNKTKDIGPAFGQKLLYRGWDQFSASEKDLYYKRLDVTREARIGRLEDEVIRLKGEEKVGTAADKERIKEKRERAEWEIKETRKRIKAARDEVAAAKAAERAATRR